MAKHVARSSATRFTNHKEALDYHTAMSVARQLEGLKPCTDPVMLVRDFTTFSVYQCNSCVFTYCLDKENPHDSTTA